MAIPFKREERLSAPFNMALFTLEKVHNILKQIATISTLYLESNESNTQLTRGEALHLKARLIRQLFIQSIPLFDMDQDKEFKDEINNRTKEALFNLPFISVVNSVDKRIIGKKEGFSLDVENELDDITIKIQEKLQEHRYFMPSKADPRFALGDY